MLRAEEIRKTSHVQNGLNVLNEDTDVAGEQGLYLHSWGWQSRQIVEDRVSGRLKA